MAFKRTLSIPLVVIAALAALSSGAARRTLYHSVGEARGRTNGRRARSLGRKDEGEGSWQAERRGSATSPWGIPWRGWKDILLRTYSKMNDDRLLAVAGGLVFFVLLAIFPAIGALVSLYALFADPATISQHLSVVGGVMPADSFQPLSGEVERIASKSNGTLGAAAVFGVLFAIWSANAGTKAIFDGLNVAYGEKEKRSFIRLNLISLAFT